MKDKMDQSPAINSNPVLSVKKDGTVLYSNKAGELLLHDWGVEIGERLPSSIIDPVQRVISRNSPEKMEVKVGKSVYLVVFHPLSLQECVNISGFDITAQKELEEKPPESKEIYQELFNLIEQAVQIGEIVFDEQGQPIDNIILDVNLAYEKLSGFRREEVIGRSFKERFPIVEQTWLDRYGEVVRTGMGMHFEEQNASLDRWFEVFASPLGGNRFIAVFSDITKHKQTEETLQESKARVDSIFKSSPVGIGVVVGRIIKEASERLCDMTGYPREELLGRNALMLYPTTEEYERAGRVKYRMIAEHSTGHVETRWRRKDGSIVDILLSSSPLIPGDLSGEITFTALDITERKRAEEEVQSTSNMLQLIMNNIPQGIFWKDRNSRYMGCNKVFAKDTGVGSPENIVGKTDYDLPWSPEQTDWFREYDRRIMENDTPEYRIVEPLQEVDGKLAWVETNKVPLHDAKGNVIGILGTYEDITERKKAEEALRLSNLYNRSLIEASLDPLVTIGRNGKIMDVNGATEQVTGYSRNELIGTDFSDYFTEPERARAGYKHVFTDDEVRDYPLEIQHKDGHITPVLYNASVYRDENGEVIGVFAAARDITELKKTEEALKKAHDSLEEKVKERTSELEKAYISLKESEEHLSDSQKIAHIGNWEWNIVTNEEYWSDEVYRIFGLDPQFGLNHITFLNCIHPDDLGDVNNAINEALNGKPYNIDYRIILPDGKERVIYSEGGVFFDEKNTPIRMRGIFQDITERKKAEESLANVEIIRKKEIHHRIKNNLQVISSLLDLQAEQFRNRENIKDSEVLEAFRESQDRVASIALIHEELHEGKETDELNFSQYLERLVENLFQTYRFGNINISLNLDLEENVFFDMDIAVPLGMIVNELVSNSLKHAFIGRDRGEIQIKLHREESTEFECEDFKTTSTSFTLTVSDNGVGIPEDLDIEDLASLGVQLVTSLVDQLDGEFELKVNNGTEFIMRFKVIK